MPSDRYYFDGVLSIDTPFKLEGSQWQHMTKVMRVRVGEQVEVVNGRGDLAQAQVQELHKRYAMLKLTDVQSQPKSSYRQILVQALPRRGRLETIVEKVTELGVTDIWLFPGEKSERKELSSEAQKRVREITIAALKQCGRLYLPDIVLCPPLSKWSELVNGLGAYYGDLSSDAPLFQSLWSAELGGCLFFVGPEAGFTDQEESHLRALGARGVKLHRHILRTDTAPLLAFGLINHWLLQ